MIQTRRLSNAQFITPDLERQAEYYREVLGLTETGREKGVVYLASVNDHHSLVLRAGDHAQCNRIALQIDAATDLNDAAKHLDAMGVASRRMSDAEPSIADALVFTDPKGTEVLLYTEQDYASQGFGKQGIVPRKLGHIAFSTQDVLGVCKFYCDALGFKESDRIEDYFVFLRCGPDHHTLNFVENAQNKMHHIAWEVADMNHMVHACDFLGHNGYDIIWGPGRHVRGHNIFTYHRNPDGQIIELYTQLDQIEGGLMDHFEPRPWHEKRPHRPQRWSRDPRATNLWGPLPPADFMA